jgi:hypothetical protein
MIRQKKDRNSNNPGAQLAAIIETAEHDPAEEGSKPIAGRGADAGRVLPQSMIQQKKDRNSSVNATAAPDQSYRRA